VDAVGTFKRGRHSFHSGCPATDNDLYRNSSSSAEADSDRDAFRWILFRPEFGNRCETSRQERSRKFDELVQAFGFAGGGEQSSNNSGGCAAYCDQESSRATCWKIFAEH